MQSENDNQRHTTPCNGLYVDYTDSTNIPSNTVFMHMQKSIELDSIIQLLDRDISTGIYFYDIIYDIIFMISIC